jgi:endonuclease YncB( thermonuclease family)
MERENMCRKTFIIGILCVSAGVCFADKKTETGSGTKAVRTYGGAIVEKITGVDEGFVFRCNIREWPAVIAEDIAVRIDAVGPPLVVTSGSMPNKFFESQLNKYLEIMFAKAQAVRLENIKRGRTFSIVADVIVDSNSVADLLIAEGLARPCAQGQEPHISTGQLSEQIQAGAANEAVYVASKNSKVFHRPGCRYAKIISDGNLVRFNSKAEATQTGRRTCKTCSP